MQNKTNNIPDNQVAANANATGGAGFLRTAITSLVARVRAFGTTSAEAAAGVDPAAAAPSDSRYPKQDSKGLWRYENGDLARDPTMAPPANFFMSVYYQNNDNVTKIESLGNFAAEPYGFDLAKFLADPKALELCKERIHGAGIPLKVAHTLVLHHGRRSEPVEFSLQDQATARAYVAWRSEVATTDGVKK